MSSFEINLRARTNFRPRLFEGNYFERCFVRDFYTTGIDFNYTIAQTYWNSVDIFSNLSYPNIQDIKHHGVLAL